MIRRWRRWRSRRAFTRAVADAYTADVARLYGIKPRDMRRAVDRSTVRELVGLVEHLDRADELGAEAVGHVRQAVNLMGGGNAKAA